MKSLQKICGEVGINANEFREVLRRLKLDALEREAAGNRYLYIEDIGRFTIRRKSFSYKVWQGKALFLPYQIELAMYPPRRRAQNVWNFDQDVSFAVKPSWTGIGIITMGIEWNRSQHVVFGITAPAVDPTFVSEGSVTASVDSNILRLALLCRFGEPMSGFVSWKIFCRAEAIWMGTGLAVRNRRIFTADHPDGIASGDNNFALVDSPGTLGPAYQTELTAAGVPLNLTRQIAKRSLRDAWISF